MRRGEEKRNNKQLEAEDGGEQTGGPTSTIFEPEEEHRRSEEHRFFLTDKKCTRIESRRQPAGSGGWHPWGHLLAFHCHRCCNMVSDASEKKDGEEGKKQEYRRSEIDACLWRGETNKRAQERREGIEEEMKIGRL
jgi:hypothetical protein